LIPVDKKDQIQTVEIKLQRFGNTDIVNDPEFGRSIVLSREMDWTEGEIKEIVETESVIGAFPPDMLSEFLHNLTTTLNVELEDLFKGPISPGKYSKESIRPETSLTGSLYEKRMLSSLEQYLNGRMTIRKHYQEADVTRFISLFLKEGSEMASNEYDSTTLFKMLVDAKILIEYQLDHNTTCYRVRGERLLD